MSLPNVFPLSFPHVYSATLPPMRLQNIEREHPVPHEAIRVASHVTGVDVGEIMARRGPQAWCEARALAVWLLYHHFKWSHQRITDLWGNRSHAFSINLCKLCDRVCREELWLDKRNEAIVKLNR